MRNVPQDAPTHKLCPKCGQALPVTAFNKRSDLPDVLCSTCRDCVAQYNRAYREAKREELNARQRAYHEANKEELNAKARIYREANKEVLNTNNRAYQKANKERLKRQRTERRDREREKVQEIRHAQYLRNRDRILEQKRDYYQENREERSAFNRLWAKSNPEKKRSYEHAREARKRGNGGCYTVAQWEDLKVRHHYTCLRCGKCEPEIKLTVDHVIPLELGGSNGIDNLQPLCKICNSAKGCKIIDYR